MKRLFRKIHLWLSVPFGIFITLICFSGAMLVFEKEITELCRHDLYYVKEVKEKPLPLDSLMKSVAATLPDSVSVTGVTISSEPERAWQVSLSKPRRASVYIDQYTGEVKGRSGRLPFYDTMFHLHRWMLGSSTGFGKLLVGISTLVLVIVLITGILMWLTNRHKPLKKSLTISFTKGWHRFWHDLHVAGGIYATIFLLALALTGLTWSFSWYRTGFYGMFGVEASAGHGGARERGRDAGHERGGRHEYDKNGRGREKSHAKNDSVRGEKTMEHRHHHDKVKETPRLEADEIVADKIEPKEPENGRQRPMDDAERPHNDEGYGHRGRHERGGKDGRHYSRHHRTDSLQVDVTESETVVAEEKTTAPEREVKDVGATAHKRQDRSGKHKYSAKRENANRRKTQKPDSLQNNVLASSRDTVSVEQPAIGQPFAHWQDVYERLVKANPDYRQITLSDGSADVVPAGRNSLRAGDRFFFDAESGKIVGNKPYSEQEKDTKVRSAVYTVHVGSWGGLLTRILTFLAALLGATLPLTGYYLWIRRLVNKSAHRHNK